MSKDLPGVPSKLLATGEPPKSHDVTKSLCVTHSFFTVQKPRAKVPPVLFESKKGNRSCARNILSPLNADQERVITNSPRLNSPRYTTKSQRQFRHKSRAIIAAFFAISKLLVLIYFSASKYLRPATSLMHIYQVGIDNIGALSANYPAT